MMIIVKFGDIWGSFFIAEFGELSNIMGFCTFSFGKAKALTSKIGCTVTQQLEFRTKNTLDPFHHGQTWRTKFHLSPRYGPKNRIPKRWTIPTLTLGPIRGFGLGSRLQSKNLVENTHEWHSSPSVWRTKQSSKWECCEYFPSTF